MTHPIRMYTTDGWVDLGIPAPASQQEGAADFSATATDYSIPSAAWGTPGWYVPITVGPNQVWEVSYCAPFYCVTAATSVLQRMTIQSSAGGATPSGVTGMSRHYYWYPSNVLGALGRISIQGFDRVMTDATVPAGTILRICQQFFGNSNANGRLLRDGTWYFTQAWRRV